MYVCMYIYTYNYMIYIYISVRVVRKVTVAMSTCKPN